jgi:hypothetical protein
LNDCGSGNDHVIYYKLNSDVGFASPWNTQTTLHISCITYSTAVPQDKEQNLKRERIKNEKKENKKDERTCQDSLQAETQCLVLLDHPFSV